LEYSISKEKVGIYKTVFEGNVSQGIDLDFNLPDYCPDIQKILRCQAYPRILRKRIAGEKLEVEGIVIVNLVYLDSEKMILRSCEYTSQFSLYHKLKKDLNLKDETNLAIFSKANIEYINCRAITQRRLDIHGEFSVSSKIKVKKEGELPSSVEEDDVEQKTETISVNSLCNVVQKEFNITETIQLEKDLMPIESIINSNLTVKVKDYRVITNKLIINCEAKLDLLYINNIETGELNNFSHIIPFSQIVDVEDLVEDDICSLKIQSLNHDINIKTDATGESGLLALDASFVASVCSFKNKEINILKDAYSTKYLSNVSSKKIELSTFLKQISPEFNHETKVDLSNINVSRIIDLRNELFSVKAKKENNNIKFTGKYNICIFYINLENELSYFEKIIDFEYLHNLEENNKDLLIEPSLNIESINYSLTENKNLELKTKIVLNSDLYEVNKINTLEKISCDEEKPINKENDASLTLYYAGEEESLWDIAKKYSVSESLIKEENDLLEEEKLEPRTMILIPNK
jgi:LysM repeat protein